MIYNIVYSDQHTSAMDLHFGIDHDIDEAESKRREAFERMFRKAPECLTSAGAFDAVLQANGFFLLWTHLDGTVEYVDSAETDEALVFLQRDWTHRGYLRAAYRVCISKPGEGKHYFRVRSTWQLARVLESWVLQQAQ